MLLEGGVVDEGWRGERFGGVKPLEPTKLYKSASAAASLEIRSYCNIIRRFPYITWWKQLTQYSSVNSA